jgi:DNA replication protein DnaC
MAAFGSIRRCPDCRDSDRAFRLGRLAQAAGLSDAQRLQTFDRLTPVRGLGEAVKACSDWAQLPMGWLVIWGARGCGKTHLSCAVANALIAAERPCVWWHVPDLVNQARLASSEQRLHQLDAELRRAPVLILDSLAAARGTEFVLQDLLEPMLDARYRDEMPTMVTAIGSPEQIKAEWSADIGSRLMDRRVCQVVHNTAPSYRERSNHGQTG